MRGALITAGLIGVVPLADAAPFPPVFPLASLFPAGGGDGSRGFVLTGISTSDRAGLSVSEAGDINGDGVGDLIIGAPSASAGGTQGGETYVVFGSTQGFPAIVPLASLHPAGGGDGSRGFVLAGTDLSGGAGWSVSAAGDVNGDGIDDLVVGDVVAGERDRGESFVVFGSRERFPAIVPLESLYPANGGDGRRGFVLVGIDQLDYSGYSVSGAGDINGDGLGDVIVGAPRADGGKGESYVVFGSIEAFPAIMPLASLYPAGGGDGSRGFVLHGIYDHDYSGASVSAAGDVNGDGIDDLVIGAWRGDDGDGESYVVFGSRGGFPAVFPLASLYPAGGGDGNRGFVLTGIDSGDNSGRFVSAAGDVNEDGTDDLIIGAPLADPRGEDSAGESYVVFGSAQGFPPIVPLAHLHPAGGGDGSRGFVITGFDPEDYVGWSVSAAGDVNADGTDDVIISSWDFNTFDSEVNDGYVVFGSTVGFPALVPLASLYPGGDGDGSRGVVLASLDTYGATVSSVSSAGDVNGDGIDDVIVGAPYARSHLDLSAGESYVVFGRAAAP